MLYQYQQFQTVWQPEEKGALKQMQSITYAEIDSFRNLYQTYFTNANFQILYLSIQAELKRTLCKIQIAKTID